MLTVRRGSSFLEVGVNEGAELEVAYNVVLRGSKGRQCHVFRIADLLFGEGIGIDTTQVDISAFFAPSGEEHILRKLSVVRV